MNRPAYIAFDVVPAAKGSAVHIEAFSRLIGRAHSVNLVTVAPGVNASSPNERWRGVFHTELPAVGRTLIDRVLYFRRELWSWLQANQPPLVHFRSIYEGVPLLRLRPRPKLIFEVNGMPSIELKYRYPTAGDDRELMAKLIAQEQACLEAADHIITPSNVTAAYLQRRGIDRRSITVIPNGVHTRDFPPRAPRSRPPGVYELLYFGTLASWQGVDLAVRAVAQIAAAFPVRLTIVGSATREQNAAIQELACKLRVTPCIRLLGPLTQPGLAALMTNSDAIVAPLTRNDRNTVQGCCPLKVLEGMASGTPLVTSDLEVVRELGSDGVHFSLIKPGSVDQLAASILWLRANSSDAGQMAAAARSKAIEQYSWRTAGVSLLKTYEPFLRSL